MLERFGASDTALSTRNSDLETGSGSGASFWYAPVLHSEQAYIWYKVQAAGCKDSDLVDIYFPLPITSR